VLEPSIRLNAYAGVTLNNDPLKHLLLGLQNNRDHGKIVAQVRKLLHDGFADKSRPEVHFEVLHSMLPLSVRIGESFAGELLQYIPSALSATRKPQRSRPEVSDVPRNQAEFFERALLAAGHFDRRDDVRQLIAEFTTTIMAQPVGRRFEMVGIVTGQCLNCVRKLGLRDEIERFMSRLQSDLFLGTNLADLRQRYSSDPLIWGKVLQSLLSFASGWIASGESQRAKAILDDVRGEILRAPAGRIAPVQLPEVVKAYIAAHRFAPSDVTLERVKELIASLDPTQIANTYTSSRFYSRFHLSIVEEIILTIANDDFALGPAGRRWLDDDEYLVRKRIHADMRRERERHGL
jgi:hypothetical protein